MTLDAAAIERLYRSYGHLVLRRARTLLGSEPEAQEALQEVFASLLRDPGALRDSVVGWLYRATTHFCLNQLRNRRTAERLLQGRTAGPQTQPPAADVLAEVRRLLAQLDPQAAAAVVYHHVDGMTHDEVAALLGCSRRQVGYLLLRARQSVERAEQIA